MSSTRLGQCLIALVLASAATSASAGWRVGVGAARPIDGDGAAVVSLTWVGAQRHPWEVAAGFLGERDRPYAGPTPATWFLSGGRRLQGKHWFASAGIAWVSADNSVLSGHAQFHTGAGWQGKRWSLSLRHLSNGNTRGVNRGESYLLVERSF